MKDEKLEIGLKKLIDIVFNKIRENVKEDATTMKDRELCYVVTKYMDAAEDVIDAIQNKFENISKDDENKFISAVELYRIKLGELTHPFIKKGIEEKFGEEN